MLSKKDTFSSRTALGVFPVEIHANILKFVQTSEDLYTLSLVSSPLNLEAERELYRAIDFCNRIAWERCLLSWSVAVVGSNRRAGFVRSLTIYDATHIQGKVAGMKVEDIYLAVQKALTAIRGLQHLMIRPMPGSNTILSIQSFQDASFRLLSFTGIWRSHARIHDYKSLQFLQGQQELVEWVPWAAFGDDLTNQTLQTPILPDDVLPNLKVVVITGHRLLSYFSRPEKHIAQLWLKPSSDPSNWFDVIGAYQHLTHFKLSQSRTIGRESHKTYLASVVRLQPDLLLFHYYSTIRWNALTDQNLYTILGGLKKIQVLVLHSDYESRTPESATVFAFTTHIFHLCPSLKHLQLLHNGYTGPCFSISSKPINTSPTSDNGALDDSARVVMEGPRLFDGNSWRTWTPVISEP